VPRTEDSVSVATTDSAAARVAAPLPSIPPSQSLISEARSHYDRAIQAQRAGDWTTYGREIQLLGQVLSRLSERR
jgi:hypothetical protein